MRQQVSLIVEFPDTVPSEMLSEKRFLQALSGEFAGHWVRLIYYQYTIDRREPDAG